MSARASSQSEDGTLAGRNTEANAEIARLTKLYPTNPSVWALGQKDSMQNRLADAQAYYVEANRRWVANQKNINQSSLPAITDVEFPKDWVEKSKRRLEANTVQLTTKEKKIIEALDKPISVGFSDRPLDEALQDLSNAFDQPLLIDKKSLEDLGLDLKKGVSLQGKSLSGHFVLRADPRDSGAHVRGEGRDNPDCDRGAIQDTPHDASLLPRRSGAGRRPVQRDSVGAVHQSTANTGQRHGPH